MKDANGNTLQPYQRVSCTDNHGNVRKGFITRLEFPKNPPRCSGDEGDVLVRCDNREKVWTVPSDVVTMLTDSKFAEIVVGCQVECDTRHKNGTVFNGTIKQIERDELNALGVTYDESTVLVVREDGTEEWVYADDVEVQ